uniref:Endonuclease/exonuclease/phosphatase domain-containing protein n=1 Tax=Tetranychus urticae TaxID=32264 RepID=T1KID4_TETUR
MRPEGDRPNRFNPLDRHLSGGDLMIEFRRVDPDHQYFYPTKLPLEIQEIVGAGGIALLSGGYDADNRVRPPVKGIVLVGDFNANVSRVNEQQNNRQYDRALAKIIDDFNLKIMTGAKPTFFSNTNQARYDYILTTPNLHTEHDELNIGASDHFPLFVRIAYRETKLEGIPSGMPELRFDKFIIHAQAHLNLFNANHY